MFQFVFC